MLWNKKENEQPEKNETPQPLGKNYKFKHIKFYVFTESLAEGYYNQFG